MDEQRTYAILFAATPLVERKLMPLLDREEGRTAPDDFQLQHHEECAIYQASRILDKIDERWPPETVSEP